MVFLCIAYCSSCAAGAADSPYTEPDDGPWNGEESVAAYARRMGLPSRQVLDLGDGVYLELLLIPAGSFVMGTPEPKEPQEKTWVGQAILALGGLALLALLIPPAYRALRNGKRQWLQFSLGRFVLMTLALAVGVWGGVRWQQSRKEWGEYSSALERWKNSSVDENSVHEERMARPFYMGRYEVTQEQYQAVMRYNPSHFPGATNPVENVSWWKAAEFCSRLAEQQKQIRNGSATKEEIVWNIHLPFEAQWEFACRAGTRSAYLTGDTEEDLARCGWYEQNSSKCTHPVGKKEPNRFGLYDMLGNVWEWCQDGYAASYGRAGMDLPSVLEAPPKHTDCVLRGGSWRFYRGGCRTTNRFACRLTDRENDIGFRVVAELASPSAKPKSLRGRP